MSAVRRRNFGFRKRKRGERRKEKGKGEQGRNRNKESKEGKEGNEMMTKENNQNMPPDLKGEGGEYKARRAETQSDPPGRRKHERAGQRNESKSKRKSRETELRVGSGARTHSTDVYSVRCMYAKLNRAGALGAPRGDETFQGREIEYCRRRRGMAQELMDQDGMGCRRTEGHEGGPDLHQYTRSSTGTTENGVEFRGSFLVSRELQDETRDA
ncbi:hypothetical protein K438DRAFT_1775506 [Mycena galopus ATCC 62051]|nr:hypothetical protein K438DRAFT_1775506 [Mycena galopus ATCC 62051]